MLHAVDLPGTVPNVVAVLSVPVYLATGAVILWALGYRQVGSLPPVQRWRKTAVLVAAPVSLATSAYLIWSFGPVRIMEFLLSDNNGFDEFFTVVVLASMALGLLTSLSSPFVLRFIKTHPAWAYCRKDGRYVRTADWRTTGKIADRKERKHARLSLPLYEWNESPVNGYRRDRIVLTCPGSLRR